MHQHHYFFKALAPELQRRLQGMELATCFSQNQDELILGFCNEKEEFWVKALVHPTFSCLSFPDEFHRAKQNSVDLFPEIIGQRAQKVWVYDNERAMGLQLGEHFTLVLKLFGNRANLILCKEGVPINIFRKQQAQDFQKPCHEYHRAIDQSFEAFKELGQKKTFPTLGKEVLAYLKDRNWNNLSSEESWSLLQEALMLLHSSQYYVGEWKGEAKLWLIPPPREAANIETFDNPLEACNGFFYRYVKTFYLGREKAEALKALQHKIKSTWSYIEKTSNKLDELKTGSRYEEMGHIIMANLHNIEPRSKKAVLHDFYTGNDVSIKLNPELNPQKNAENYYRKSKNQKIEVKQLEKNIANKEAVLEELEAHEQAIEALEGLRDLRKYIKEHKLSASKQGNQQQAFPFRKFEYEGFEIWIGKNAKNNDLLTQKYAYKEDLWLHARDVAGSHTLIKFQAGKPFPDRVLEKAASLAAYYSSRKNDTLCPVIYTPKKYVRKPKGLAPGQVVVDKESVIMVESAPFQQ